MATNRRPRKSPSPSQRQQSRTVTAVVIKRVLYLGTHHTTKASYNNGITVQNIARIETNIFELWALPLILQ